MPSIPSLPRMPNSLSTNQSSVGDSPLRQRSAVCLACGAGQLEPFYAARQIPTHSVLLMPTEREAREFPRADLELVFCRDCGFIGNRLFDMRHNAYSPAYEETQHFSATFQSFAARLARDVVARYGLAGKTAVDIGCGKGEFLALLLESGMARGVGIDPSCRPERLPGTVRPRFEAVAELFRPAHLDRECDLVCCRHTLEHIGPVAEFLRDVRAGIGDRRETVVLFELPDTRRVLADCAFWDVYYEHCSYFTRDSLWRLFDRCDFEVLEMHRDFGDQYLWLVARPGRGEAGTRASDGELLETSHLIGRFRRICPQRIDQWRTLVRQAARDGERPVVWGGGSKAVAFLTTLEIGGEIECVVDINPHKQGCFLPGTAHRVVPPAALRELRPQRVLLMNPIYEQEVASELQSLDVRARIVLVN